MDIQIQIEKNVPLPVDLAPPGRRGAPLAWWRKFEVGDSAVVTAKQVTQVKAGFDYAGWKFIRRKEGELYRIWRTR